MNKITLLIHCKDQPNIIASVTNFMAKNDGNIVYIDQHVDREQDIFFMRLECEFISDSTIKRVMSESAAPFQAAATIALSSRLRGVNKPGVSTKII